MRTNPFAFAAPLLPDSSSAPAFLRSGRWILAALALFFHVPAEAQTPPPPQNARLEISTVEAWSAYEIRPRVFVKPGMPWVLERGLNMGRTTDWAPFAAGWGGAVSPLYADIHRDSSSASGGWFTADFLAKEYPYLPPPPPPTGGVGNLPGGGYLIVHAGMTHYTSGKITARWRATHFPSGTEPQILTAVFTPAELNLYPPAGPQRQPFGLGFLTGPREGTATIPRAIGASFIISSRSRTRPPFRRSPPSRGAMWMCALSSRKTPPPCARNCGRRKVPSLPRRPLPRLWNSGRSFG